MGGAQADAQGPDGALPQEDVTFGDVAHAPPKATVKQRHWGEGGKQRVQSSRHAQVMLRQLREATRAGSDVSSDDEGSNADRRAQVRPLLLACS